MTGPLDDNSADAAPGFDDAGAASAPATAPTQGPATDANRPASGRRGPLGTASSLVVAAAIVLIAGAVGGLVGYLAGSSTRSTAAAALAAGRCDAIAVADQVLPSVVTIQVQGAAPGSAGNGSGEFVRSDGYVLTNDHVISAAVPGGRISILTSSGQTLPATLVGRATPLDLAVIKVDAPEPVPVIDLSHDSVVVGQPVIALGSPLGLSGSVTSGIVSALGRDITVPADNGGNALLAGAIQTDAPINPGNSGGALVDCAGHLVGVNTAIATVPNAAGEAGGGSVGIGFAIPVELAAGVADELIATGNFRVPSFDWSVVAIPPSATAAFGVQAGLFVKSVTSGGAADTAGLQAGDVITAIDGQVASNQDVPIATALAHQVGDQVPVDFVRDGRAQQVTLKLS
ncbi:S1C family serine protease [Nakamurella lactea]|uniref:S1C family serine protease n=1 Tax=Nakamurella lactea TaxID=459515 RepID=UPI000A02C789|nr:trypsin-like peptidase domain-containing protein [Nakamurella lactea]